MLTIDSHHHFWRFNEREYGWIDPAQTALRRDFLPADLEREIRVAGVDGAISVEARPSLEETSWLCRLAERHAFIRGVVGWVPLSAPDLADVLAPLATNTKLRGVRHLLQAEADAAAFVRREDFNRGIATLQRFDLAYDLLIREHQLEAAIALVDRHPAQRFILDHLAKPRIAANVREPWTPLLRELARRPHVYCKLSGLVSEAGRDTWTEPQLRPYFDHALEVFGPSRLMFGSDWPVCLDACGYARWCEIVRGWVAPLSADEQARILGGTAIDAYRL